MNRLSTFLVIWAMCVSQLLAVGMVRAEDDDKILIFAAASLKNVIDEIVAGYPDNAQIIVSYASSGVLARQIENGAPADIFISANHSWMDYLKDGQLIAENSVSVVAENSLVLANRIGLVSSGMVQSLTVHRFAMGDPSHVPAGIYAKQALEYLGLWSRVNLNAVYSENARVALLALKRGEVDYVITYFSDIAGDKDINSSYVFSPDNHDAILYFAGLTMNASPSADGFLTYLKSQRSERIFKRYGFSKEQIASPEIEVKQAKIDYLGIVSLSLKIAFVAMLFAAPIAYATAYILARFHFFGKSFLQAFVMLPLVLPPVVTGYFLLVVFGNRGVIGTFLSSVGLEVGFHWLGAALAAAVMAFPLLVRPMRLAIEAIDVKLDDAAKSLGASRWTRFRTIILPLSLPGILAGSVLGFAKALGEFGATMTFVSNIPGETQTFSLAIYSFLQLPNGDHAALALIAVAAFIAVAAVLLSEWVSSKIVVHGADNAES